LQNPLFQKAKEDLLPSEKVPVKADEGWGKELFLGPHPPSATVPLSLRARVIFWIMDSATSPFGSAQNDRVGGILRRVKVFGLGKPTKRKSDAVCTVIGLML